ncbi:MAG: guanylate kinase [Geminicoccaceae bacterium]|nr:guanylate kinase [Geminicoccaceae bacterium]MCB9942672.1 guanylate kinase [Geminicoccaceae bacterium]
MSLVALDKLIPGRRRGLMLVMSSPSGAGKTSISRALLDQEPELALSISVTTRAQRPGEVDGRDYHFIGHDAFDQMVAEDRLLEHARVYNNAYGTPREPVFDAMHSGKDVLFDIDWQGAQQMREAAGVDMVGIFILPPSTEELARRLHSRAQDSEDVVRYRLAQIANDVTHWPEYDYVLINNDLEESVRTVRAILTAERVRRKRQPALTEFVAQFRVPPVEG